MTRSTDPNKLTGLFLDDWAALWAEHLMIPVSLFGRRGAETDDIFRARVCALVADYSR